MDPVGHYLDHGWREGRDPRPDFSTRGYLAIHEEVARAQQNPFIHYLRYRSRTESPRDASTSDDELARGERGVDQAWYLETYPDIADPVRHYLDHGWREGRDPRPDFSTHGYLAIHEEVSRAQQNPFIDYLRHRSRAESPRDASTGDDELARGERGVDQAWYLETYPDIAAAGMDPVGHYLDHGWREGRDPRPDFSTRGYLAIHEEVARAQQNPFIHYLRHRSRTESPGDASTVKSDDELARGERGVDQAWYLETYPDIADPVRHYLDRGWREGRDPRPDFSTCGYLAIHEEVARAQQNPFIHYLRYRSRTESPRDASTSDEMSSHDGERGVDQAWYLETYPDIAAAGMDPVCHYLDHGWREGRDPRPDFSTRGYLALYKDIAGSGRNPFVHYLRHGGPRGPPHDVAATSWHSLFGSLGRMARIPEWWDYKLVPILSIFYATALVEDVPIAAMWPALVALVCAIVPCAAYVSFVNDATDRVDDGRAGKTNQLTDKPPWMIALLLAVPLCFGAAFSFAWRDDPPLVTAYLCTWAAVSLYSVPPIRLKGRGIFGVVADASGAHLFPALVAALLAFRAAGKPIDPVWIGAVAAWALGYGLRGILWHQLSDIEFDRKAGMRTFVLRHSHRAGTRLAAWVALPLETIGLAMLLWQMQSPLPFAFLLLYAAYAALRQKLWAIPVVVAASRERCSVLGQEYYGLLFPLGILISLALRHPMDGAVIVAHLVMFPGPAIWFVTQIYWLARDAFTQGDSRADRGDRGDHRAGPSRTRESLRSRLRSTLTSAVRR